MHKGIPCNKKKHTHTNYGKHVVGRTDSNKSAHHRFEMWGILGGLLNTQLISLELSSPIKPELVLCFLA